MHHLFPLGSVIDLRVTSEAMVAGHVWPGLAHAHLHRVALEDGSRPAFRWCEVVGWHQVDWFAAHPPASIWEIDVIPVIRADGAISPTELGGCARTRRQPVVRLCGQFVSAGPGGPKPGPLAERQMLAARMARAQAEAQIGGD